MNGFANNVYTTTAYLFEKRQFWVQSFMSPPPTVRFLIDALVIVFKQYTIVHAWQTNIAGGGKNNKISQFGERHSFARLPIAIFFAKASVKHAGYEI